MINKAKKMKDPEKGILTGMIANLMKKSYILFNQNSFDNNIIKLHLKQLSDNELTLDEDFQFIRSSSLRQNKKPNHKKKNYKKKNK